MARSTRLYDAEVPAEVSSRHSLEIGGLSCKETLIALRLLALGRLDLAFIGGDKLEELALSHYLAGYNAIASVPIDCRLALSGLASNMAALREKLVSKETLRVVTSYPMLLGQFAARRSYNLDCELVVDGSCEASVRRGRVDLAYDIVASGKTNDANELEVVTVDRSVALQVLDQATLMYNEA